jgi:3-isopropylmalate/(R)-2-methylmalate dehydratase small subunit
MEPITSFTSTIVALPLENVDTDQIIPARYLKVTDKAGLGDGLFHAWRYNADGSPKPDFVLNRPDVQGAQILIAGNNFGCGSSREHAAWALEDYGFEVVVAPSFGDIFFSNAVQVGLVPVTLPAPAVKELMRSAADGSELTVDLEARSIAANGVVVDFEMDDFVRHSLLNGLDAIARTLQHEADIDDFERRSPSPVETTAL